MGVSYGLYFLTYINKSVKKIGFKVGGSLNLQSVFLDKVQIHILFSHPLIF